MHAFRLRSTPFLVRIGTDQLRNKALLALEEALQETRYRPVRRTFAVRFALAYLWSCKQADRTPYDEFWQALVMDTMWRFESANGALSRIYEAQGVTRDSEVAMTLWKLRYEEEKSA